MKTYPDAHDLRAIKDRKQSASGKVSGKIDDDIIFFSQLRLASIYKVEFNSRCGYWAFTIELEGY